MEKSATAPFIMEKVARPLETIAQAPKLVELGRIAARSPHPHKDALHSKDAGGARDAVPAAGVIVMCTVKITNNKQREQGPANHQEECSSPVLEYLLFQAKLGWFGNLDKYYKSTEPNTPSIGIFKKYNQE